MTDSTRTALNGVLELARAEGYVVWGFILAQDTQEVSLESFNNNRMKDGNMAIATGMALKFMRKRRSKAIQVTPKSPLELEN